MNSQPQIIVAKHTPPAQVTSRGVCDANICLKILKSNLSPISVTNSSDCRKPALKYTTCSSRRSNCFLPNVRLRVYCRVQDEDDQIGSEEPPESLFMKELKRRGMKPSSLLEEANRTNNGGIENDIKIGEDDTGYSNRNAVSTEYGRNLTNQREQSMALNSEGLEGLIPRARLLLATGATFFLGFWPLILVTVAFFCAVYLYFGQSFIHDGSDMRILAPQYVDPYELLEDERISQMAPTV